MTDTITTLRARLQQLEARHKGGTLGKKDYERARAALERELLDHVLATPAASATSAAGGLTAATRAPRPPVRLVAMLAAAVVAVAGAGYWWKGAPGLVTGVPEVASATPASPHDSGEQQQFSAAVEQLAEKLKAQPDNAEGWAILARSYAQLGRLGDAVPAYAKAVALQGDDARLLADYADALAVQNNRSLEGEPSALIERALKLDPGNPKALALAGTAAFNRKDFAGAVRHWERLAQTAPPDSPFLAQLQGSLAEARELGGLGPARALAASPATPPKAAAAAEAGAAAAVVNGTVSGTVTLAPALKGRVGPDDAIFVFARPATGSRMPLAFMRAQVKDLPLKFTLDDSMAMSPAARLSTAGQVVVGARISKSGQAMPQAGDLEGLSAPTAPGSVGIDVVIAGEVK